jgi:acetylglutamate kinase
MTRAGIPVEFVDGRRVTTAEGIEVVRASLAAVNRELWSALGPRAVPYFGHDVGLRADRVPELGLVGEPVIAELPLLVRIIEAGKIPVIAPLAAGPLNVNADDAAAAIAVGVHADSLLFLTDVEGFMLGGEVLDSLDVTDAESLHAGGTLDPTILPKLGAAITAARHGVRAFIGRTEVEPLVKEPAA